ERMQRRDNVLAQGVLLGHARHLHHLPNLLGHLARSFACLPRYFRPARRGVEERFPGAGARLRGALLALLIAAVPLTGSAQQNKTGGGADPKAEALLRPADEVRFPLSGAELTVSIRTTKN